MVSINEVISFAHSILYFFPVCWGVPVDEDVGSCRECWSISIDDTSFRLRSLDCEGSYREGEACQSCLSILKDDRFRKRRQRRRTKDKRNQKFSTSKQIRREDALKDLGEYRRQLRNMKRCARRDGMKIARLTLSREGLHNRLVASSRRTDRKGLKTHMRNLTSQSTEGDERVSLVKSILTNLMNNLDTHKNGHRFDNDVKRLFMQLYVLGGEKACMVASTMIGGPATETTQKWIRENLVHMCLGLTQSNVNAVGEVLLKSKKARSIKMRIPFEVDMDETAVQEAREYCARTDSAVGHAGRACKSRCKTKREHKKRTMQGMCSGDMPPDTMEPFVIGTGSGAYTRIVKYAETYRCASMISLIVINPRHLNLESVAVGILPTTNTFTAEDSANLYKTIETLLANSP